MEQIFITELEINNVRHLKDVKIPLDSNKKNHIILTGKNGSGKTSVLDSLALLLDNAFSDKYYMNKKEWYDNAINDKEVAVATGASEDQLLKIDDDLQSLKNKYDNSRHGLEVVFNQPTENIYLLREKYHYVLAYYKANRIFSAAQPKHVEKIQLRDDYSINDSPREDFVKYLLDLKMTEALARNNEKTEKADVIHQWFDNFEALLKKVFDDDSVRLVFDEDTFAFFIKQNNKEIFDFNTLSSGYQAVLDIVLDIIIRMENHTNHMFDFQLPGIVLIDEIETHLHLELQKNIMPMLTTIFPNIQFIVSTHSPFILNSLNDVVIYDLEKRLLVQDGLDNVPYDGIVEGYFGADALSETLKNKFVEYSNIVRKENITADDLERIAKLELYLDEIPDYLALDITTEYQRLKLEFMKRGDIIG